MPAFLRSGFVPVFAAVAAVQGVHVVEHVIQLAQVYLFGVPDDEALGLLGYVFAFQGTEEWLHLVFNVAYLAALWWLMLLMRYLVPRPVPYWAYLAFVGGAVGLETWHVIEHVVIIANVVRNDGCPCPGVGDRALGVSDTVLHFGYNAAAYLATLAPFWYVVRARRGPRPSWRAPA